MLAAGTMLGPYEILAPIGAGGMGEVYRAKDTRLGREVAIKVIPARLAVDAEHVRRFEREARAAAALNHPNVCTLLEVGTHGDLPFVVMELLRGMTLRERLRTGAIPVRTALKWTGQVASGLAAAHEQRIVHRDLKPENLFITTDGQMKILDFGLAKLIRPEAPPEAEGGTLSASLTQSETILGTTGYMSPEQVRAQPVDHRTDLFSLGAVLYEMLTGSRAFPGDSFVESSYAILTLEPPALEPGAGQLPAGLAGLLAHCLEKRPEDRFQTARDLAFALHALAELQPETPSAWLARRRLLLGTTLGVLLIVAALLGVVVARWQRARQSMPTFRRLTFGRGAVAWARFAADGRTVVFSASWDGKSPEVFSSRLGSLETRRLGFQDAQILSVSNADEMALLVRVHNVPTVYQAGTLAVASLAGGPSRELLDNVLGADWAPDGKRMAAIRYLGNSCRLEFPIGRRLVERPTFLSHPRVSPRGDAVAFLEHVGFGVDDGGVDVVNERGEVRTLSRGWTTVWGLAWGPGGNELWFTASKAGEQNALYAVTLGGKLRLVEKIPGSLVLHDVGRDGRALIGTRILRFEIMGKRADDADEQSFTWLGRSWPRDLTADGRTVLVDEENETNAAPVTWLRKMDDSEPVRLGVGTPRAISPDGRWVVLIDSLHRVVAVPTRAGESRVLGGDSLETLDAAKWFPDGSRIALLSRLRGRHVERTFVAALDGSTVSAVTPEGVGGCAVSPDGRELVARNADSTYSIYPIGPGAPRAIRGLGGDDTVIRWSADGRSLFVMQLGWTAEIDRFELATGRRTPWRTLAPQDLAGVYTVPPWSVSMTADGLSYVYGVGRDLSDLYLMEPAR